MTTAPAAGTMLGRYQVLKPLARGGMAEVLLARAIGLKGFERHVVIKRIRVEKGSDQKSIDMFLDEARLAGSLHHRNIVQVHDVGEEDGKYFFVMEYVHGRDARELLRTVKDNKAQIPLEHVIAIVTAAAAGLHYAHEQRGPDRKPLGIVHRDVSPGNILLAFDGGVKVADFGIAKAHVRSADTQAGEMKGKVGYMSPEQCKAQPIDRRTDIFQLGIVLYELCTVRRLFKLDTRYETMTAIVDRDVTPPSKFRNDLPTELEQIILKALAKSPDDRYRTADELRLALEAFAARAGLSLSAGRLSDYLKELYGDVPEPWLVDERPPDPDPERISRPSLITPASDTAPVPAPASVADTAAATASAAVTASASAADTVADTAVATTSAADTAAATASVADTAAAPDTAPASETATSAPSPSDPLPDSTPPPVAPHSNADTTPDRGSAATSTKSTRASSPVPMVWPVDPRSERRRKAMLIALGILAAGGLAFLAAAFLGAGEAPLAASPAAVAPSAHSDAASTAGSAASSIQGSATKPMTADAEASEPAPDADAAQPAPHTADPAATQPTQELAEPDPAPAAPEPVRPPPKRVRRPQRHRPAATRKPASAATPAEAKPASAATPADQTRPGAPSRRTTTVPKDTKPARGAAPSDEPAAPPAGIRSAPTEDGPPPPPAEATAPAPQP